MKRFPCGSFGRQKLEFHAAPFRAPLRAFAALMFAWQGDKVLLCDIAGRGWCVPSGRVEPNENSLDAVKREALEEGGAVVECVQYLGCYRVTERREVRWVDCYASRLLELGEISHCEESKGCRMATMDELPEIYHLWNPLTECVFRHSRDVVRRLERFG